MILLGLIKSLSRRNRVVMRLRRSLDFSLPTQEREVCERRAWYSDRPLLISFLVHTATYWSDSTYMLAGELLSDWEAGNVAFVNELYH